MPDDARFRQLMDAAPVLIWCADAERRFVYVNKVWLDFTGRNMEQEFGYGWASGVHPQDCRQSSALVAAHFESREPFRLEFRLRRHDGAWRWMLGTGVPRHDPAGTFIGFLGSCTDVTEMKESESRRQHDLDEKAALLQELHHRVKNNAQVFASLLGVQANRANNQEVKLALRTAASRAGAIAIAQQQIYDAGAATELDLAALARRLLPTTRARSLEIELEAPRPVPVPHAAAVPLALILHELLANAAQHAFPDGREGRVNIRISRRAGELSIAVADNGIGIPEAAANGTRRSVGLTITRSLARQLCAVLSFERQGGTVARLTVPPATLLPGGPGRPA